MPCPHWRVVVLEAGYLDSGDHPQRMLRSVDDELVILHNNNRYCLLIIGILTLSQVITLPCGWVIWKPYQNRQFFGVLDGKMFYKHNIIFLSESLKVTYIDLPQLEFGRQIRVFSTEGLDLIEAVSNEIAKNLNFQVLYMKMNYNKS